MGRNFLKKRYICKWEKMGKTPARFDVFQISIRSSPNIDWKRISTWIEWRKRITHGKKKRPDVVIALWDGVVQHDEKIGISGALLPKKHIKMNCNTVTRPQDPRKTDNPEIKQSISCWQVKSKWRCEWTTSRDAPNWISICVIIKITFRESSFGHKELSINKVRSNTRHNTSNSSEFKEKYDWVKKIDRGAFQASCTVCRLFNCVERNFYIKRK